MNGILADTSVWIDFFHGKDNQESIILREIIENNEPLHMCPIIYQEILQGIRDDRAFIEIKDILKAYPMIPIDLLTVTDTAINMYRELRKKGITIRKSADCLIASYALLGDLYLFHKDRDFTEIAKGVNLTIYQKN
jgi:predicted nucleic acid-binding protein